MLWDQADDFDLILAAADHPAVTTSREDLDRVERWILVRQLPEIERTLGKPVPRPADRVYAMPVAQPRVIMLSGLRYTDEKLNKHHTDFHPVGDVGAVEIRYGIGGERPAAVVVYLAVDEAFPKLTEENLARRVAWDRRRFRELVRIIADARRGQAAAEAAAVGAWATAAGEWPSELPGEPESVADADSPGRQPSGARAWWAAGAAVLVGGVVVGYSVWARRLARRTEQR
jgi:hypothetical protein